MVESPVRCRFSILPVMKGEPNDCAAHPHALKARVGCNREFYGDQS
jgi:hypothetical protein